MGTVLQIAQENPNMPGSYYRARYYDPAAGRFVSEDPARFAEGMNFFSYVDNNVPNLRDPLGLGPKPPQQLHYANTVASCDQGFQECQSKAKRQAFKGGFFVFVATGLTFDLGIAGCVGTGAAAAPCILLLEELQTAITPILLAPFGGNYFDNVADCWNQRTKCLGQQCKK